MRWGIDLWNAERGRAGLGVGEAGRFLRGEWAVIQPERHLASGFRCSTCSGRLECVHIRDSLHVR